MKNLIRLSLALYLAALLAPLAHELLVDGEEGACERCEAAVYQGPILGSRCDESSPCENPDHHHHHRHHIHGQCPVCQHTQAAGLQASRSTFDTVPAVTSLRVASHAEGVDRRRELCLHLARAPPVLS